MIRLVLFRYRQEYSLYSIISNKKKVKIGFYT
jgi:hypothetical protein